MNQHVSFAIAVIVLGAACGAPPDEIRPTGTDAADGGAVVFALQQISAETTGCVDDGAPCARVAINTLETIGGGNPAVRENVDLYLEHDLVSRLRGFLPEDVGSRTNTADELAAAFLAQHRAFVADFPDSPARWFIEIEAEAIHNTDMVTTIEISETAYTGGAHPNARRRLVSFDVATGRLLGIEDLTSDIDGLTASVEHHLRKNQGLGSDGDLEAVGFWFPEAGFTLPDNVGVVADGLRFHWDAYEIAPYSMGPIDVLVPVAEIEGAVRSDDWQ